MNFFLQNQFWRALSASTRAPSISLDSSWKVDVFCTIYERSSSKTHEYTRIRRHLWKKSFSKFEKVHFSKIGFSTIAFWASFGQHLLTKNQQLLSFQKVQKKWYRIVNFQGDVKIRIFNAFWRFCFLTCAQCDLFQNFCFKIVSKKMFQNCFKIGSLGFKIEPKWFQNSKI